MEKYSDKEILDGLKNRQRNVVLFVTEEYLPMINYLVGRMGGSNQDAEDIFQEALMAVLRKLDKGELKLTAKFKTFFYAICRNLRLCQLNEQKRENDHMYTYLNDTYYAEADPERLNELRERTFQHYFDQLSKVCKEILKLYTVQLSVKEIAEELGNTEKYIRKRKYECKNRLSKLVSEDKDKILV